MESGGCLAPGGEMEDAIATPKLLETKEIKVLQKVHNKTKAERGKVVEGNASFLLYGNNH